MANFLGYIAGAIGGILNGMGLGGGVILIPILEVSGITLRSAQVINLLAYTIASIIVSISNYKSGYVRDRIYIFLALSGIAFGCLGAILGSKVSDELIKRIIGMIIIVVGTSQIKESIKKDL